MVPGVGLSTASGSKLKTTTVKQNPHAAPPSPSKPPSPLSPCSWRSRPPSPPEAPRLPPRHNPQQPCAAAYLPPAPRASPSATPTPRRFYLAPPAIDVNAPRVVHSSGVVQMECAEYCWKACGRSTHWLQGHPDYGVVTTTGLNQFVLA